MKHRLSVELTEATKAFTRGNARLAAVVCEICELLDGMATRASVAGTAARGKSGRHRTPFDIDAATKLRAAGVSIG